MSELYPTPTRLALLRDVADNEVWQDPDGKSVVTMRDVFGVSDPVAHCTAAIAELERAGWVHLFEGKYGARLWQLTDAGRAVLDTHGGQS